MNIDFSNNPGFSAYVLLLMASGLAMVLVGSPIVRRQRASSRVLNIIIGLGFFAYGFYLAFIFNGGHYFIFFKAFILPVVLIIRAIAGSRNARKTPQGQVPAPAPQQWNNQYAPPPNPYGGAPAPYAAQPQQPYGVQPQGGQYAQPQQQYGAQPQGGQYAQPQGGPYAQPQASPYSAPPTPYAPPAPSSYAPTPDPYAQTWTPRGPVPNTDQRGPESGDQEH